MIGTVLRHQSAPGSRPRTALIFGIIVVALTASCGGSPSVSPGAVDGSPTASPSTAAPSDASPTASPSTAAPSDGSPTASPSTAAPSTPAASGSSAGAVDACAILSAADIAEIVGATPTSMAAPGGGWSAGACTWNSEKGSFLLSVGTAESIRAFGDPGAPDAKARLAQFRQAMSAAGSPRDIDDIGDGAVVFDGGIAAYKAGTYVEVLNLGLTEDQLIKIVELAIEKA